MTHAWRRLSSVEAADCFLSIHTVQSGQPHLCHDASKRVMCETATSRRYWPPPVSSRPSPEVLILRGLIPRSNRMEITLKSIVTVTVAVNANCYAPYSITVYRKHRLRAGKLGWPSQTEATLGRAAKRKQLQTRPQEGTKDRG